MMDSTRLWIRCALLLMFVCSSGGCATIISGRKHQVTINNPGGPTFFMVQDEKGAVVHSGVTPQQVTLKSSSGPFRPAKYSVIYAGQEGAFRDELHTNVNWWTAGNIIIGGIPGLVVDAATGAMWRFDSEIQGQVPASLVVADIAQGQAIVSGRDIPFSGPPTSTGSMSSATIQQASFGDKSSPSFQQPAPRRPTDTPSSHDQFR